MLLLAHSLSLTLSSYPHFAGQLSLTPYPSSPSPPHHLRFRRTLISHGHPSDPGVEFEVAYLDIPAAKIFPDATARATTHKTWDATNLPIHEWFLPAASSAVQDITFQPNTPSLQIRVTIFFCHALAIGIKLSHALGDAETLVSFMTAWGSVHRSVMATSPLPELCPVFDPMLLDACASGCINAPAPDPAILAQAEKLPLPRFDWWAHKRGNPARLDSNPKAVIPAEVPAEVAAARRPGAPFPWQDWDLDQPVAHRILRIEGAEVDDLYTEVVNAREKVDADVAEISRHDVVLAFMWHLIALARPPKPEAADGYTLCFNITLGLRRRLGLPREFVGSPILPTGLSAPYGLVAGGMPISSNVEGVQEYAGRVVPDSHVLYQTAALLRRHISRFDREALGAWLHEMAFDIAPQRIWNGFLGNRHVLATSWVRAGVWGVDFGFGLDGDHRQVVNEKECNDGQVNGKIAAQGGEKEKKVPGLRWAGNVMNHLDGLITITEAEAGWGREWWKGGVDVDTMLEARVMEKVLLMLDEWRKRRS
jgi:Transferase family